MTNNNNIETSENHIDRTQHNGLIYNLSLTSVLFFIIIMPWADGISDGLVRIFGILAFGMSSLLFVIKGTHRNYTYYHILIILLWSWVIFSVVWTPNIESGLEFAPRLFQIMLLPFLFTLVITSRHSLLLAYQAYVIGNIIGSSIIIYNYLNGIESPYYGRYTIQNIETDTMSIILVLAIPMAAYLTSIVPSKLMRIINTLAIPYVVFAIFLTGTRTGSIVAIIGVLYWLFTHRKASMKIRAVIIVLFMSSIIAVASFAPKASIERVFSAGKSIESGNLNYRTVIWSASLSQWRDSPVIGTGLGGLGNALSREHVNYAAAHNTHIQLLVENGMIGFFLYVLLELSILLIILKTKSLSEKAFLITLFGSIVVSQLTLHTHMQKETWFAFTMIVIQGLTLQKQRFT